MNLQNKNQEIWADVIRSVGDLAGAFEFDGETSYFYLYKVSDGQKVLDAIHIMSGTPDFGAEDIAIRWTSDESIVGLFIRAQLYAAFDIKTNVKHGGNYHASVPQQIPLTVLQAFN